MDEAVEDCMELINQDPDILYNHKMTPEAFLKLLKLCIDHCYFEFDNKYYIQAEGGPMGSSLTEALAERKMQKLETTAITNSSIPVGFWRRFVDDALAKFKDKQASEEFHNYLNSLSPKLKFTIEHPVNNKLPFLDTLIHLPDHSLSVYRKPTHTNRYLNYKSCHPQATKDGIVSSLIDRALMICDPQHIKAELESITKTLQSNGYPRHKVQNIIRARSKRMEKGPIEQESHLNKFKTWVTIPFVPKVGYKLRKIFNKHGVGVHFSSSRTIKNSICKPKTPKPPEAKKNVIYKLTCECDKVYIGQTSQPFNKRLKQHHKDLNLPLERVTHSSAKHQMETGHIIHWDNPEIVACPKWPSQLNTYEHMAIKTFKAVEPSGLNKDVGPYIANNWQAFRKNIKFTPKKVPGIQ